MSPPEDLGPFGPRCTTSISQTVPVTTTTNTILIAMKSASLVGFGRFSWRLSIKSVELTRPTARLLEQGYPGLTRRHVYANDFDGCLENVSLALIRDYSIRSSEWGNAWSLRPYIQDNICIDDSCLDSCKRCLTCKKCVVCTSERKWRVRLASQNMIWWSFAPHCSLQHQMERYHRPAPRR